MKRVVGSIVTLFSSWVFIVTLPAVSPALVQSIVQAPRVHLKDGTSTNWSGYAVETNLSSPKSNVVTDVKGTWTVPAATCTAAATYASFWVGIDGYEPSISTTVEQTGTESDCYNGRASYYAWYEMYPKGSVHINNFAVQPGNVIHAEVHYAGNNNFTLSINNASTGANYSITLYGRNAVRDSAEWIAEAPSSSSGILPLTNFGTVHFSGASATINGVTGVISNAAWQRDALTMKNTSGAIKAAVSALGTGGNNFSVTWQRSS